MSPNEIIILCVGMALGFIGISFGILGIWWNRIRKAIYKRKIRKAEERYEEACKDRELSTTATRSPSLSMHVKRQMQELRNEALPDFWTPVYEMETLSISREMIDPEKLRGPK